MNKNSDLSIFRNVLLPLLAGVVLAVLVVVKYDQDMAVIKQYYLLSAEAETARLKETIKGYLDIDLYHSIDMLSSLSGLWRPAPGTMMLSANVLAVLNDAAGTLFAGQAVEALYIMIPATAAQPSLSPGPPAWQVIRIAPGSPVIGGFRTAPTLAPAAAAALERQWAWLYAGPGPATTGHRPSYRTELVSATAPAGQSGQMLYSVPVIGERGQVAAMITAVLDLSVLRQYLHEPNYLLHHANHALLVTPHEDGFWRQANPWSTAQGLESAAIYNEIVELSLADASGPWQLWAGEEGALFWSRLDVRTARLFVMVALTLTLLLTLALIIYNLISHRDKHRILKKNEELEVAVKQRTAELRQSLREIKRLAGRVNRDKEKLRAILDSSADGIITADEQGIIEHVSGAAERMFGYTAEQLIGNNVKALMPADVAGSHDQFMRHYREDEGGSVIIGKGARQLTAQRSDGSLFDVEISVAPMKQGGQRKLVAVIRDISRRTQAEQKQQALAGQLKAAQQQLMQSEKMAAIGQLAAGIAHEINNPVGYIASNISILDGYIRGLTKLIAAYEASAALPAQGDGKGLERLAELKQQLDIDYLLQDVGDLIKESQEGVTRVKQIVQDLKDFAHIDEAEWQWADLHRGLDSTLNVVNNEIKYKADVIKEYGTLPEIECIPSQLNQVFMNLLVNAAHAIEEYGTITIRSGVDERQGRVWVEIADNGVGIAAEKLSQIFDPFYTSKPVGQGTGLGLSLSYSIIEKHGGRIEVESEPGQGTTFRIWLPIKQAG